MWGDDDDEESLRADGGFNYGTNFAIGETSFSSVQIYEDGKYIGVFNISITLLDVSNVTVPAGTFTNCLHLRIDMTGATTQTSDEWWATGVGVVKLLGISGDGSKQLRELKWYSFKVDPAPSIASPGIALLLLSKSKKVTPVDADKDGYTVAQGDCNDSDATIYPSATEICGDGIDQDCSGSYLECDGTLSVKSAGQTWMDRNLGASRVATNSADAEAYGDLYQWGRGTDGHEKRNSPTTYLGSSTDSPGHGDFILIAGDEDNWRTPQNDNLWQGVSGINNPCPAGFRLPTETELNTERASWTSQNSAGAFASPLKLVVAGARNPWSGALYSGSFGIYWSSTTFGIFGISWGFTYDSVAFESAYRAYGRSVRCLKD